MAEDKKGIIVYASWKKKFDKLSDEEAGRLIKHFFAYVNDENPVAPDRITEISFVDIEDTLKRDLKKWEKRAERSRENGKSGGRPPINKPNEPKETHQVISEPEKPVNVIDIVNVNVIDKVINKEQGDLILKICDFFEYNSPNYKTQQSLIWSFVFSLPHKNKLDFFIKEFDAYCELKTLDGYKHKLQNFLGDQSDQFKNGKWDDNWTKLLYDYKKKNNMSETKTVIETAIQKHRRKQQERAEQNGK